MPDRTFILSAPGLNFCEDVEAEDFRQAIARIGVSGYFGQAIEEGNFFSGIEAQRYFQDGLLVVYVLDTQTMEAARFELQMHFVLSGMGGDPDYIRPEVS